MPETAVRTRLATPDDAAGVLAVYAPYVRRTPISFETEVPALGDFRARMEDIMADYPYLVVEEGGRVVGFAYAHRLGERAAYAWNAELSIYLDAAHTGRGWGGQLSRALLHLLRAQGVRNVFSLITVPNPASIALHESLGFQHMGTQRRAGFKQGAWHDVAWMQLALGDFKGEPAPLVRARDLPEEVVRQALARAPQSERP